MKVFVVGARPNSKFPKTSPDLVYGVNGAIERIQQFSDQAKLKGVVGKNALVSTNSKAKKTRSKIKGSKVDVLYVSGASEEDEIRKRAKKYLDFGKIEFIKKERRSKLTNRHLGYLRCLKFIYGRSGLYSCLKSFLKMVLGYETPNMLLSNGVFSIIIHLEKSNKKTEIYTIGIGISSGEGHYYDLDKTYGSSHIEQDKFAIERINNMYSTDIKYSDDVNINKLLGNENCML